MVEAGVLLAAGHTLEYERVTGKTGPVLVLLHEGLGCVAMWKRFPALLHAATGLGVLVYSRAGYGRSSPVALPRPLDFHSHEASLVLPAVLEAAGIDDCILIGHSDGASIALILAGTAQDPRLRALAVIAPHVLTEQRTVMTIREASREFAGGDLRTRLARHHGDNVDCAFWGWCDTWLDPRFRAWNIEAALSAITVPVLTVRGDDDQYSSAVHVRRIAARVAGPVECRALPGCGHAPHLEQTEALVDYLAEFIAPLAAATFKDRR